MIAFTVAIQPAMFTLLSNRIGPLIQHARHWLRRFANTGVITIAAPYVLLVQTVCVWVWAFAFSVAVTPVRCLPPA